MSPDECIAAIKGYFELYNAKDARLFRRSKKPEDFVEAKKMATETAGIGAVIWNRTTGAKGVFSWISKFGFTVR